MTKRPDWIAIVVVYFRDRIEGELMEAGTREECRELLNNMEAVIYNKEGERPTDARVMVIPRPADCKHWQIGQRFCREYDRESREYFEMMLSRN